MDMDELKKKAKDALPSDEQIEKVADKVEEHAPDEAGRTIGKAEQWAKDNN
ncbi:hypothetical protein [Demequina pelophila]|uniref:hypothetical protein n=1 Tax=Demequina pelophila TaxID=1638984 RepID=UPI000AA440B0|nr:hypothetical protein [Demequina pelophila]